MTRPTLYDEALDAGDRLVAALSRGDIAAAQAALDDRGRLLDEIRAAPHPSPPLADRLRAQQDQVREALAAHTRTVAEALGATGRAAAAQRRYAPTPRGPVMDTAPR